MRKDQAVAIQNSEQGVQRVRTAGPAGTLHGLAWDDLRFFLQVDRLGSLRAAATAEKVTVNTVRARIEKLEAGYGAPLLRRTRTGSAPTDAGEAVLEVAREMQRAAQASPRDTSRNVLIAPGEVRLFCSEGLGLLWLTPRLGGLRQHLGGVTVNLAIDYDLSRDRSSHADISLAFHKPQDPDMVTSRLATLHYMVFAAPSYLREHGIPATFDDMRRHRIVEQVTPGVNSGLIDFFLGTERPDGLIPIRTNSSLAQLWAVANGAGIAPMPTFVRAVTRNVVPIGPPLNLRFDLFCSYHASGRGSPAVEAVLAWLRRCFDGGDHPWFRDHFVHPDAFGTAGKGGRVVSLFDNLIDPVARS
ncbi:MAG: hypothetical protein JWO81_1869 [Alphaproteobacteria bacterium]|nr:hypothetical protein [Alphaproteobacteria bacterium]